MAGGVKTFGLKDVCGFLDTELDIQCIEDSSLNGLQVQNSGRVTRVGVAVDACMDVFRKAKQAGCDFLLVHHGLFWGPQCLIGNAYDRVKFLLENDIALYAAHLPLDKHAVHGNNACLFRILEADITGDFSRVGFHGRFRNPRQCKEIILLLNKELDAECISFLHGKEKVRTLAVVSGGAAKNIINAEQQGVDLFITGEPNHSMVTLAKDSGLNAICPGHYATETLGVREVAKVLEDRFQFRTVFIDNPTGI